METITATITYPLEQIEAFADRLGYQTVVKNENYVPEVGSPQIVDPTWEQPADFNPITGTTPMVDNPDYVPAVGTPTIDNPEDRVAFVKRMFKAHSVAWFTQFAAVDAEAAARAQKEAALTQTKAAVEKAITI